MKIRLTVEEAERLACALCYCKIELEAQAHNPDVHPEHRKQAAMSAPFFEKWCNRFLDAAEKSKGVVTIDIE